MAKKISEVMSRDVETVNPTETLRDAAEKMRALNVGSLPVIEGNRPIGVITDRDIVVRAIALGKDATATVRDAMSEDVQSIRENDSVDKALEKMKVHQIRRLLVVDGQGQLCGVVALGDLAQEASDRRTGETLEKISEPSAPSM